MNDISNDIVYDDILQEVEITGARAVDATTAAKAPVVISRALVDTGAISSNFISHKLARRLKDARIISCRNKICSPKLKQVCSCNGVCSSIRECYDLTLIC